MSQFIKEGLLFIRQNKLNKGILVVVEYISIFFVQLYDFIENLFILFQLDQIVLTTFVYFLSIVYVKIFALMYSKAFFFLVFLK